MDLSPWWRESGLLGGATGWPVVPFTEVEKQDMNPWEDEDFDFDVNLLGLGGIPGRREETIRF